MIRTIHDGYGSETIKYRGLRPWLSLPQHISNAQSINEFKKAIKSLNVADCTCSLYRTFIPQLGFLSYHDTPEPDFRIFKNRMLILLVYVFNSVLKFYTIHFKPYSFNHVCIFIGSINFSSWLG